jgi:lipoprotein-anchoring transpeptidase ErfK/SrfK
MKHFHLWMARAFFWAIIVASSSIFYVQEVRPALFGQDPIDVSQLGGDYDRAHATGEFNGQPVVSHDSLPTASIPTVKPVPPITEPVKRIEVDLTAQRLYAFEGDKKVYDFLISSGKWNRTPTGIFHIWGKYRFTKMSGGNPLAHTYYYLPNVPYVMFFSNDEVAAARGFSLHGTYWHNNFGHPMSHGCVNMKTEEAGIIYHWSAPVVGEGNTTKADRENPGTEIFIYGAAPEE